MNYYKDIDIIYNYYFKKKYIEALYQTDQCLKLYKYKKQELIFMKLCILCKLNKIKDIEVLIEKILEEKCWLNPYDLIKEQDLYLIRSMDYFNSLYDFSLNCFKEYSSNQKYIEYCNIRNFNNESNNIMYIHGIGSNITEAINECEVIFNPILSSANVIIPQSEEVYLYNQYCWDNEKLASDSIRNTINKYNLKNFLLAGKSQGGRIALKLFSENPKLINLYLLIPALNSLDNMELLITKMKVNSRKKIFVITSENDFYRKNVEQFIYLLKKNNIMCKIKTLNNCAHYILESYNKSYEEALKFFQVL
jgi:predicted esterase